MNIKKIAIATASVALMIGSSVPAFASNNHDNNHNNGGTTNVAFVTNSSSATANTGNNVQGNYADISRAGADDVEVGGNNRLRTGNANANASAGVVANNQVGCGCDSNAKNTAFVRNGADAGANSGANVQGNGVIANRAHLDEVKVNGNNQAKTGNARSNSRAWTLVNNQVSVN